MKTKSLRCFRIVLLATLYLILLLSLVGCQTKENAESNREPSEVTTTQSDSNGKAGYYVEKLSDSYLLYKDGRRAREFSGLKKMTIKELSEKKALYYFTGGVLDTSAKGLVQYGEEVYYVRNGSVDDSYSGTVEQKGFTWIVTNGKVSSGPNGTTVVSGKAYTVKDGQVYLK